MRQVHPGELYSVPIKVTCALARGAHEGSKVLLDFVVFVLVGDGPPCPSLQPLDEVLPPTRIHFEVKKSGVSVPIS
jgi:hypothetical protein